MRELPQTRAPVDETDEPEAAVSIVFDVLQLVGLAVFIVAATVGGFLVGPPFGFGALSLASLVATVLLAWGSDG